MLLDVKQGTSEWLVARCGLVTASRLNDVLARLKDGKSSAARENYKYELVAERLTHQPALKYVSAEMQWGVDNEPAARVEYAWSRQVEVVETGLYLHDSLKFAASPDGLVSDDTLIEIKSPTSRTHLQTLAHGMSKDHLPQIYGQQWVTGRAYTDFISYDPRLPEPYKLYVERVERDEKFIEKIETAVREFLDEVEALERTIRERVSYE
jgi:hypothetical protein